MPKQEDTECLPCDGQGCPRCRPICACCNHRADRHGRRGYGSCGVLSPTDEMRQLAAKWEAEHPREVAIRLIETALALPGKHVACACKRYRSHAVAA